MRPQEIAIPPNLQRIQPNDVIDGKYIVLRRINKGLFGLVLVCRLKDEPSMNPTHVIKFLTDDKRNPMDEVQFTNSICRSLCPNKVELVDNKEYFGYHVIVMKYCPYTFDDLMVLSPCLPQQIVRSMAYQMVSFLHYLHDQLNIIHRDFKLENILLDHDGYIRVCDFGFSKQLQNSNDVTNSTLGTPYVLAAQVRNHESYSFKVDVFALGACIYRLITSQLLSLKMKDQISQKEIREALEKIKNGKKLDPRQPDFNSVSDKLLHFLQRCLEHNQQRRASSEQLLNHDWFKEPLDFQKQKKFVIQTYQKKKLLKNICKILQHEIWSEIDCYTSCAIHADTLQLPQDGKYNIQNFLVSTIRSILLSTIKIQLGQNIPYQMTCSNLGYSLQKLKNEKIASLIKTVQESQEYDSRIPSSFSCSKTSKFNQKFSVIQFKVLKYIRAQMFQILCTPQSNISTKTKQLELYLRVLKLVSNNIHSPFIFKFRPADNSEDIELYPSREKIIIQSPKTFDQNTKNRVYSQESNIGYRDCLRKDLEAHWKWEWNSSQDNTLADDDDLKKLIILAELHLDAFTVKNK